MGEVVEDLLHSDEIDAWVAQLSAIVPIRHVVNDLIRKIAQGKNVVVEGRDITTVVFPMQNTGFFWMPALNLGLEGDLCRESPNSAWRRCRGYP
jgi:cytidylate kinase